MFKDQNKEIKELRKQNEKFSERIFSKDASNKYLKEQLVEYKKEFEAMVKTLANNRAESQKLQSVL